MRTETPILKETDFRKVKRLPDTVRYAEDIEPCVIEAQEFDLLPVFPDDMAADLAVTIANLGTIAGPELYDQSAYNALLPYMVDVVAWFAYSRYWKEAGIDMTRSGPVVKNATPNSTPVDSATRSSQAQQAQAKAAHYVERMITFLNDNATDYPEWTDADRPTVKRSGVGIGSVGRLDYTDDRTRW